MSATQAYTFPKSARLLKTRDFHMQPCGRFQTEHFRFFFSDAGTGRLGVSLSKKVLRRAVARNRVRRLIREVFRHGRSHLLGVDVHMVGKQALKTDWSRLGKSEIEAEFQRWASVVRCG